MQTLGTDGRAHKVRLVGVIAGTMLLAFAQTASGQTTPPAGNPLDQAPSEAARRAAMSPYRFILQHASTPRKPAAAPAAAAPTAAAPAAAAFAPAAEPKRAPSPPVQQAAAQPTATQTVRALEPAEPAAARAAVPEAAPAALQDAAIAAISRQPAEPPPRLEIIPVRTDEPRLPPALLREQPKGTVKIAFDIQQDGTTRDVKVLASTNRALNRPTVEAVQNWKFEPVDAVLTVETEVVYKID